jgi:diguanylate cyclase (GGDEF)-like protein/PAS domain S-box-containing protein
MDANAEREPPRELRVDLPSLDAIPDPVYVLDGEARVLHANHAAEEFFGIACDQWRGKVPLDLVHSEDLPIVMSSLHEVRKKAAGTPIEVRVRVRDGSWRLVEVVGGSYIDGGDLRILNTLRDLTERRRWELAASDVGRFRTLVENAPTIIMHVNATGRILSASGAFTRQLGHDLTHVLGARLVDFVEESEHDAAWQFLSDACSRPGTKVAELELVDIKSRAVPYQILSVNLVDDPVVGGLVVAAYDISARRILERRLAHLATHDVLTGLPNRAHAVDVLTSFLERPDARARRLAVLFVDLDRFKPVNDLYGHDVGDRLLVIVAQRLRSAVRPTDVVARFGGDEFLIVCDDIDAAEAAKVVERIETVLADPIELDGRVIQVFASVGMVDGQASPSARHLVAEADAAMYERKQRRRARVDSPALPLTERRELAESLRRALDGDSSGITLSLHFQPIVDLGTLKTCAVEALLRGTHVRLGEVSPTRIVPVADEAGLAGRLGEWVLRAALMQLAAWDLSGVAVGSISVNLSPIQLIDPKLPRVVSDALTSLGVTANRLCLEMNESAVLEYRTPAERPPAVDQLEALHDLGLVLAIDDFGTGYSSLTHLRDLPFDLVKIDQTFVDEVDQKDDVARICRAAIAFAHSTGKPVIAEGVARLGQHERLVDFGANRAQGHLYCAAMSAAMLEGVLRENDLGASVRSAAALDVG